MKVLLASKSEIKIKAVKEILGNDIDLETISCDNLGLPSQPIDSAEQCALIRLENIMMIPGYDVYIAIENGIYQLSFEDVCVIAVYRNEKITTAKSIGVPLDSKSYERYLAASNEVNRLGRDVTYGKFLSLSASKSNPISHDNWMKQIAGIDRHDQIISALKLIWN